MWQNFLPHNAANSYKLITRDYFIFGFSFSGLQRSCFWPSFIFYTDVIVWLKQKSAYIPRPWHRSKGSPPWRQWSWEGRAHLSSWSRSEMSKRPWCPEKMKKNVVEVLFRFFLSPILSLKHNSSFCYASIKVMWMVLEYVCQIVS